MDRVKHHIERLLRRNYSKIGVLGKLSDMNLRNNEDESDLYKNIDDIFDKILKEGNHNVGTNKGKSKSQFLYLKI